MQKCKYLQKIQHYSSFTSTRTLHEWAGTWNENLDNWVVNSLFPSSTPTASSLPPIQANLQCTPGLTTRTRLPLPNVLYFSNILFCIYPIFLSYFSNIFFCISLFHIFIFQSGMVCHSILLGLACWWWSSCHQGRDGAFVAAPMAQQFYMLYIQCLHNLYRFTSPCQLESLALLEILPVRLWSQPSLCQPW